MPRYIDAEKLDTRQRGNNSQRTMWLEIKWIVDTAPTADVQEVKHGKWIEDYAFSHHCSECGDYLIGFPKCRLRNFKYCPNCGAKMDGGESK